MFGGFDIYSSAAAYQSD